MKDPSAEKKETKNPIENNPKNETFENKDVENFVQKIKKRVLAVLKKGIRKVENIFKTPRDFIKKSILDKAQKVVEKAGGAIPMGTKVIKLTRESANDMLDIVTLKLTDDPHEKKGIIPKLIRVPIPFGTALSIVLDDIWKKMKSLFTSKNKSFDLQTKSSKK